MKNLIFTCFIFAYNAINAQERGNAVYESNAVYGNNAYNYNSPYYNNYNSPRNPQNYLPNDSVYTIGARVAINLLPDAYIAVFAVQQEGLTVAECNNSMNIRIEAFKKGVFATGIKEDDFFVDMVAQARIYDYKIVGKTATEMGKGYELKKNMIIKFTDHSLLEKLLLLAAEQEIYDLVKVDYILTDPQKTQKQLQDAVYEIIEGKKKHLFEKSSLFLSDKGLVMFENYNTVYPSEAYKSYVAAESSSVQPSYYNHDMWVKEQRKSRTFYFDKLNSAQFDKVINPAMVKIPVQMTIEVEVKYYIGKPEKKTRKG